MMKCVLPGCATEYYWTMYISAKNYVTLWYTSCPGCSLYGEGMPHCSPRDEKKVTLGLGKGIQNDPVE